MRYDGHSPFTHGMEIEQFPAAVNSEAGRALHGDGWHRDGSGPQEKSFGAYKTGKTILNRFFEETRDEGRTWDWHGAHDSAGAGSHVHLKVERDVFDDHIQAWTISYNSVVETFPFLALYFCHDWEQGFREGTEYRGHAGNEELNIQHWAQGQLTRYSQDSVQEHIERPNSYTRSFDSVTFNSPSGEKPMTIEIRANDAHPAMALPGLLQLRRLTGRCIERGISPKLEDHRETLERCYEKIYQRARDVGLLTAMQEEIDGGITFQEGRGLPGVDQRDFDTMFEVLRAIQIAYPQTPNTWRCRAYNLVRAGRDEYGPQNNTEALWNIDGEQGAFEWENGPTDETSAAEEEVA